MNDIFRPYLDIFVIVFVYDILIYSKSEEEHEQYLRVALEVLRKHHLYAKLSKCKFFKEKVSYLGHVISKHGTAHDPSKVKEIQE